MTLRENILLGVPLEKEKTISNMDCLKVLKITYLQEDLKSMSDELNTKIGNISGGVSDGQMH